MRHRAPLLALPLVLALASAARGAEAPATPTPHVPFVEGKPFAEVLARAQREKKPVMVDVFASWCNPCKWMDRNTFTDPKVVAWVAAHAVPARVDGEKGEGRKLASRYAVSSYPTILFLDANGKEIDRLMGAHGPAEFPQLGEQILSGKSPLATAIAGLKTKWSGDTASEVVNALGQRNDLARVRPIALRIVSEDPDLADPKALGALAVLVGLEDFAGSLSPETADLIETYLPKLGADPRRPLFAVVLARELARRGDAAGLRALDAKIGKTLPRDAYLADLWSALGEGERKAGAYDASAAAYKKAIALLEELHVAPIFLAARQLDLAETLLAAKKTTEGRAQIDKGLATLPIDPGVLVRAANLQLLAGQKESALKNARQAVESTGGQEAGAHAALAKALAANGDAKGAQAAWARAHQIDPDNPEYGKPLPRRAS